MQTKSSRRFTRREVVFLATICFFVLLTRAPWIFDGYGLDPDSFRVITVGRHIIQTGEYIYSRPPGYPFYEFLTSFTANFPPQFSNGLTAIFSCIAFLFFALILRYFCISPYLLLASAFALTPVVYVNSVSTMDYIFAIAFMLGSTYFILARLPIVAGICLGLAIGCRITSGAMLLPLIIWMFLEENRATATKHCLIFSATTMMIGGLCFVPVIKQYGLGFFTFYDNQGYPSLKSLFSIGVIGVWGEIAFLGFVGLGFLYPFVFQNCRKAFTQTSVKNGIILSSIVVTIYIAVFLRLPIESGYLIPIVPFILLTVGLLAEPFFVRYLAVVLLLSSFITISSSGVVALSGPIIEDHWKRESQIEETTKVIEAVERLSGSAVIVAGWHLPEIALVLKGERQQKHQYVYLIEDAETYKQYVAQGRVVYFLPGIDAEHLKEYKIDLKQLGAQQLNVLAKR